MLVQSLLGDEWSDSVDAVWEQKTYGGWIVRSMSSNNGIIWGGLEDRMLHIVQ